jgi:hypothetical protein
MKPTVIISLLFILIHPVTAQSPWTKMWDKRFGGATTDILTTIAATSDDGLLIGGQSWSQAGADKTDSNCTSGFTAADYWIVRTDSSGGKLWDRTFGGNTSEILNQVLEISSGQFMIAGHSISDSTCDKSYHSWGNNSYDYWILKLDTNGNKIWDHAYGGTRDDKLQLMMPAPDGGFILAGTSSSDSSGDKSQNSWHNPQNNNPTNDYWIVRIDSTGNKLWDRTFGGTAQEQLTCIQFTDDGGYIIGGFSTSGISGDKSEASFDTSVNNTNYKSDYWIIKTDSLGIKEWDRTYGGLNQDHLFSIVQSPDRGFMLGGYSKSGTGGNKSQQGNGGFDYWIVRTDSVGNIVWDRSLGGSGNDGQWSMWPWVDTGYLIADKDGGYIMSGASESGISGDKTENNLGPRQVWVVKVDSLGNKIWDKTIFTNATEDNGIMVTKGDSCFVIGIGTDAGPGGEKTEPSQGVTDYWTVVYCQPAMYVGTGHEAIALNPEIYPSPCQNELHISLPGTRHGKVSVNIYDVPGQKVAALEHIGLEHIVVTAFSALSPGMYVVEVIEGQGRSVSKVIKQ